jgi:multiple sugar transport system substrate-binding protein
MILTESPLRLSRRKFLTRSFLFAGGTVVLAACSSQSNATSPNVPGKVTLTQWFHEYGEPGVFQAVHSYAAEYTKQNPHVAINIVWVPSTVYATKLFTALASSSPPDIYEYYQTTIPMVQNNWCAPLDDIITPSVAADFQPSDKAFTTYQGKTYGIKEVDDTWMLFYRTSMLKQHGVSTSPPTNFDDLVARAQKLTTSTVKGLFVGNDGIGRLDPMIIGSNGANLTTGNKITFANSQVAATLEGLRRLDGMNVLLKGYPEDSDLPGAFTAGATAIQLTGFWNVPQFTQGVGNDFGAWPWPRFSSAGSPQAGVGGWTEYVHGKSPHLDEAKAFIKWLWVDNASAQLQFNSAYGDHVPPRTSVAASDTVLQSGVGKDVVDIMHTYGNAYEEEPIWDSNVNTAWTDAVTAIVVQGKPALPTLQAAQAQAQKQVQSELS